MHWRGIHIRWIDKLQSFKGLLHLLMWVHE